MASAMSVSKTVEKTILVEEPAGIALFLDEDEAQFLRDVMGFIGGDPNTSRRRHQIAIVTALKPYTERRTAAHGTLTDLDRGDRYNGLYFKDEK